MNFHFLSINIKIRIKVTCWSLRDGAVVRLVSHATYSLLIVGIYVVPKHHQELLPGMSPQKTK